MLPAQLFFWTHDYNASIKAAANLLGRKLGDCRKPQLPLKDADLAELKRALEPLSSPVRRVA
jgi:dihydrodipicolinate synthase/N-acetylneuraminate lyase